MALDGLADLLQEREHRFRATAAVQTDDVGALGLELLDALDPVDALQRLVVDGEEVDHRRQVVLLDDLESDLRLSEMADGLRDDEVNALASGPADLLVVHLADHVPSGLVVGVLKEGFRTKYYDDLAAAKS